MTADSRESGSTRPLFGRSIRPAARAVCLSFALVLFAAHAFALDIVIKDVRTSSSLVTTAIEIRDAFPERFRKLVDEGGVLHLRLQAELWESRPVWDRLVYPAIVRVFRMARAPSRRDISISDSAGTTSTQATVPNPLPVVIELGKTDRLNASAKYYVHVLATIGTLAEREADDVGDAVFGRESEANSLGSLGRFVVRTMIKVSDYLQSVSAEASTKKLPGADILRNPPH
jgi:hypothetical protein